MNRRWDLLLALSALLLFTISIVVALSARQSLTTPLHLEEERLLYTLEPGSSLGAFARDLAELELIESSRWLVWYGRVTGGAGSLRSGEYLIERGMTPLQLLARVRAGEVIQHAITFVEGWTFARWREELAGQTWIRHEFAGVSDEVVMRRLGMPGEHPEGRFFPDTYRFERGVTDREVLGSAAARMREILAEEWSLRDPTLQLAEPYDALILASLVEKESGVPADRERIASVFLRRLAQRLRLQSDPTVIYGLGSAFTGDLTRRDLQRETPYNTYVHFGLPPTPICSPGRGAIHAALHPAPGSSLYFVAKGDGTSHFSDTLEEHNRAVKRYQVEQRAEGYRSAPPPAADGSAGAEGRTDPAERD